MFMRLVTKLRIQNGLAYKIRNIQYLRQEDSISLEIQQLEHLIKLQQEKIHYLKELRTNNESIIITNEQLNELVSKRPYHKSNKREQYLERIFTNRMLKKSEYHFDKFINDAMIIQTFQYRTASDAVSSQMLVLLSNETVELYDLGGILIQRYNLSYSPQYIITSSRGDDSILGFASHSQFDLLKIENVKTEEVINNRTKAKFVLSLYSEISIEINSTAQCYAQIKGNKFIIFGDQNGVISIYHRNGTLQNERKISNYPIKQIIKYYPHLLFQTDQSFGYFDPNTLEIHQPFCDNLPFKIKQLIMDLQQNNIVYVLGDNQEIYVYETKQNDQCRMKQKLILEGDYSNILSLRQFLITYDQLNQEASVFNTSDVLTDEFLDYNKPTKYELIQLDYNILSLKKSQIQQLLQLKQIKDLKIIANQPIMKLICPKKRILTYLQTLDMLCKAFLQNLRIGVAIFMIVLYQFWYKNKDSTQKGQRNGKKRETDDAEIEQLLRGAGIQNPKQQNQVQPKNPKFDEDMKRVDQFKEQLDTINQKTRQMQEKVGVQYDQKQKIAQNILQQNKKYV
ncbi:hypothetical protein pb186bvf_015390 [Paramecium bursaria]